MARCPACNSSKGKRQCRLHPAPVCPQCCGESRRAELCGDCGFFKPPTRDYNHLPRYDTSEMSASKQLLGLSLPIEAAVCALDRVLGLRMKDSHAIAVFELLLDLYAFGDQREALASRIAELGCADVVLQVEKELAKNDVKEVAKVLATIRFVARRRNIGGRHHLDVLHEFCSPFGAQR